MKRISVPVAIMGVALTACSSDMPVTQSGVGLPSLSTVSAQEWERLRQRPIFFGHQSVGKNIVTGIESILTNHTRASLKLVESKAFAAGSFSHGYVGRNYYPLEKLDDFTRVAESAPEQGAVAMLKFCYEDVVKYPDARGLFAEYKRRIAALHETRPAMTIVHFTMPLRESENWKGRLKKAVLRQTTERDRNAIRNEYNALLRAEYAGKEPVFDIAALESTLPDGRRSYFTRGSDTVFTLATPYSSDGGHLNDAGQRMVAEQLLITLAKLPSR